MHPPQHPMEPERLRELRRYAVLDTDREREFDEIVELASQLCGVPVCVINFIDAERQWFKAEVGLGVRSTPLDTSLCGHAILQGDFVEIPDTLQDARMADNPLCTGDDGFRFYAGAVLKGANNLPLGTLCVLDIRPRTLDPTQRRVLRVLANQVMRELDLRLSLDREKVLRREIDHRVKNSLASIAALISMKARRSANGEVREALDDVCVRIRSLASLHGELHEIDEGSKVDLASLFERIKHDLKQLVAANLDLVFEVEARQVSPALANAMLLIANEFISNSAKHGFDETAGTVTIAIAATDDGWEMVCRDDGKGDEDAALRASAASGLGTQVIRSIASSIGASMEWRSLSPGMELKVAGTVI